MSLILIGVNHRTAPVEVRERLSIAEAKLPDTIGEARRLAGVDGAALLYTCNRVETVFSAASEDVIEIAVDWLSGRTGVPRQELEKHLYILRHVDVVKHLFRVA